MLKKIVRIFGGDPNKREIENYSELVDQVNSLETQFEGLSEEALCAKTDEFRSRLAEAVEGLEGEPRKKALQEALDEVLPEAFAAVREASKRTLGLRHYDVQLIGGAALHNKKIAEMRTGEGKTLVATLPLYLNALTRQGAHLVTVNDYLARRDARWMAPIYAALGLTVGVLQMAARTENGRKAFLVDLEKESPHEDQHQLRLVTRAEAYAADITYGTNSEFGFDYLRDNMTMRLEDRVQRGHYYAIIDEVDNVLIDEARTPLIISGPAQDESEWYTKLSAVVRQLRPEDYEISEKDRNVVLTEIGEVHVEEILGMTLRDPDMPEDVTPEQARMLGYLEQALRAQFLFRRNKDYLVQGGKVIIIDEFTGRLMPGRRWSDGLHQAVEAKEGVKVESESVTYATVTIQNYFRMYEKLAGMTGTALTEAEEFDKIYSLAVLPIPTNLEYQASRAGSGLEELEERDQDGYKYRYYARRDDPNKTPVYYRRKDYPDIVYRTEEAKLRAMAQEILRYHVVGRPLLVGTTSVEMSERVSNRLRAESLRRLTQTLMLRQAWMEKFNREEDGRQVPELQFLNNQLEKLDVAEMRKLARDLEISFNPEDPESLDRLLRILDLGETDRARLLADLQAGISHEVLNARKHTEESQIIAGAGAFGAVTIATNMAGRGVDIKLGGELAEEIAAAVNRILSRSGHKDPYDMPLEARSQALLAMDPAEWGIYETEIRYFLQHLEDMERVRSLGGLHVIGSERHEARRIDNQLRGRAARQGDPGSSRFYLSMDDELMRLFGGGQADALMQRLKIDDAMPLEVGLVGRLVEQSQTRVEGANFDVRKHLLEYDDVLNTQRSKIYAQRNRIFMKDDLSEDVTEMLRTEVTRRVPEALQDEEGPWKLLSWLDSVQPSLTIGSTVFPSYTLRILADRILGSQAVISREAALPALLDLARRSVDAEQDHVLRSVVTLVDQTEERLDSQLKERLEAVDTFFEGLSIEEEGAEPRRPADLQTELSALARTPLKLTPEQLRTLRDDPQSLAEDVSAQVENSLFLQTLGRLIGAIERRLEEPLDLSPAQLPMDDWGELADRLLDAVTGVFDRRRERFFGAAQSTAALQGEGQITKDVENWLEKGSPTVSRVQLYGLLLLLPQGARAVFDRKSHRRLVQRTTRLTYTFAAAHLLDGQPGEEVAEEVLEHLEEAQAAVRDAWGTAEFYRLANQNIRELDEKSRRGLENALGVESFAQVAGQPLGTLIAADREAVVDELGRQTLTEIYRQLLLSVITELWVDYLTQMEALRVSIGLEAYGQRDPLVQYKSRAFELFQTLLGNMRLGVINRMFTYRPRDLAAVQAQNDATREVAREPDRQGTAAGVDEVARADAASATSASAQDRAEPILEAGRSGASQPADRTAGGDGSGKRKRRRRR